MNVIRMALVGSAFLSASFFFLIPANAQPVPASSNAPVSYPISTVRNVSTIGPYTVAPHNVPRHAFAHAIGGLVQADAQTVIPLNGGRSLPVVVRSTIPKATVAGAIGRFALKALPLLSTGAALYELGEELGFGIDNTGGQPVITRDSINIGCDAYPQRPNFVACGGEPPTPALPEKYVKIQSGQRFCFQRDQCGGALANGTYYFDVQDGLAAPATTSAEPASVSDLEAAINDKADWSPLSPLARAFRDAIAAGESVSFSPSSVTGPATTPGPVTVTNDTTNNTTTTSTTVNNHTYAGNSVTTTTTTTNVTVNNSTGQVVNSSTVINQPDLPEREDDSAEATDTPLPAVPKLYTPKYPQGLKGVWNAKKDELDAAPLVQLLESLMPAVGSSGSCPSWMLPVDVGIANFGTYNVAPPCWVWDFGKVIIVVSALLLARRLVFGG